jgi:hypothetical protein
MKLDIALPNILNSKSKEGENGSNGELRCSASSVLSLAPS